MALGILPFDVSEVKQIILWRDLLVEFIGTALLAFSCSTSAVVLGDGGPVGRLQMALAIGFTVMILVEIFMHFSGSHLHPGFTLTLLLMKLISPVKGLMYVIMQLTEAYFGLTLTQTVVSGVQLQQLVLAPGIQPWQGFLNEVSLQIFIVMLVQSLLDPARGQVHGISIILGFCVIWLVMCGGQLTGPAINPAFVVAFGFASGNWTNHWVFWLGPFTGDVLAVLIYNALTSVSSEEVTPEISNILIEETERSTTEDDNNNEEETPLTLDE